MPQVLALESEVLVNPVTAGDQQLLVLDTNPSGAVLVSWYNYPAGSGPEIQARVVQADGTPLGNVFALPDDAEATLFDDGSVGAVYLNSGVKFQHYDINGNALGAPVSVAAQGDVAHVEALAGGGAVVVYHSYNGGAADDIFAQVLDSAYAPVGSAIVVDHPFAAREINVTPLAGGEFLVSWVEVFDTYPTLTFDVHSQAYRQDGSPLGPDVIHGGNALPPIEALPDGGYAVIDLGVFKVFDADGTERHPNAHVNVMNGSMVSLGNGLVLISGTTSAQLVHIDGLPVGEAFALPANGADPTGYQILEEIAPGAFVRLVEHAEGAGGNTAPDDVGLQFWSLTDNVVVGTPNADDLSGLGGDKVLVGLGGNDRYTVDGNGDYVGEAIGGGTDSVFATANYNLTPSAEVEELATTDDAGTAAIYLVGNNYAQTIRGNNGVNSLIGNGAGAGGHDTLIGLGGDDLIYLGTANDVVVEAVGGGYDRVYASFTYVLTAGAEVEILAATDMNATTVINLTGNAFAQYIYGTQGQNVLEGGGGGDVLVGLGGADTYIIRDSRDSVREAAGGSIGDRVLAATDFTLLAGQHVEIIGTIDAAATTPLRLTGNEIAQEISGNAGANVLTGGGGADVLLGYAGDDWYFVSDSRTVIGGENGVGGNDRVFSSVSYTLSSSAAIEMLTTADNLGTQAIDLTGNALAGQLIYGNQGSNRLNGGGGGDTLIGFGGNDFYVVGHAADQINESAGGGSDRLYASLDYRLNGGAEVEIMTTNDNLATTGIDLTGNEFDQYLYGNAGSNVLDGGRGRDTLVGMGGADYFLFTTGLNTEFVSNFFAVAPGGNVDRIYDFGVDDKILLDGDLFGFTPGALPAGAFNTGSVATEADDRILFDQASRALLYDADGAGGSAALLIAFIDNPFNLDASYIAVV